MCDILFDEKIAGSLHFTPGQAYEECDNGNRSAVHWDMVLIQRPGLGRWRNLVRRRTHPQERNVRAEGLEAAQSSQLKVAISPLRSAYFSSFKTARNCFIAGERTLFRL